MPITQRIKVEFSVSVPGCEEPLHMVQWIPFTLSDHVLDNLTGTASAPLYEVPAHVPAKLRTEITANGLPKLVPAVLAQCMLDLAQGAAQVKLRPEVFARLKQLCPDVASLLVLNRNMKLIRKKATYDVKPSATTVVKVAP